MKNLKCYLTIVNLLWLIPINAQTVNKTYELTNYLLEPKCVVAKVDDSALFYTAQSYEQSPPFRENLLITKTDVSGNFIQSILIDSQQYEKHRLIGVNGGVLLATYNNTDLHVIKFDLSLNSIWSKVIPMNGLPSLYYTFVDIERSYDDTGAEVYYIINAATTPLSQYVNTDRAISVTKLSEYGSLVWHKIYTDNNRVNQPWPYLVDLPNNITAIDSSYNEFAIIGNRHVSDTSSGTGMTTDNLFIMIIDKNGNITGNYQEVYTLHPAPILPDIAWDSYNDLIVSSYRETSIGSTIPLRIGLITYNRSLSPIAGKNYWYTTRNMPTSITVSGDTSYIIGATFISGAPAFSMNPGFVEIDNSTLSVARMARYNILQTAPNYSYHIADEYGYKYMLPKVYRTFQSVRMIKADFALDACGASYEEVYDTSYTPMAYLHLYDAYDRDSIYDFTFTNQAPILQVDDCDTTTDEDRYKPATVALQGAEMDIHVYPTFLNGPSKITCRINSIKTGTAAIVATNMLGQISAKISAELKAGQNEIMIQDDQLSAGLNIIRISVDGQPVNTTKIIVTKQ